MDVFTIISAVIVAFVAAVVDAVAGGGGVVVLPYLMFLGFPIDMVLGTNKLAGSFGTCLATYKFVSQKKFSTFVPRYCLLFTIIGALFGSLCVSLVSPDFLKPIVSFLVIAIAIYFFFKPEIGVSSLEQSLTNKKIIVGIVAALLLGFYDGIFGPGTGTFLMFLFIRFFGQDFITATGNTKILNLASNIVALIIFAAHGKVIWEIGIPMAVASMIGGYVGANLAIAKGAKWVRWIFIVMALLVGVKLLFF